MDESWLAVLLLWGAAMAVLGAIVIRARRLRS